MNSKAPNRNPWTRYWAPLDLAPMIDSDGFLFEREPWLQARFAENARTLEELANEPSVVLLGESGMGKTHELLHEERRLKHADYLVARRRFGSFGQGRLPFDRLLEGDEFDRWRREGATLYLLLDAIDEAVETPERTADLLTDLLRSQQGDLSNLRLRITGRSAVWTNAMRAALEGILGPANVYVLQPLQRSQAVVLLAGLNVPDAAEALDGLVKKGLGPLASRPLTLTLLATQLHEKGAAIEHWKLSDVYRSALLRRRYEALPRDLGDVTRHTRAREFEQATHVFGAMTVLGGCVEFSLRPQPGEAGTALEALIVQGMDVTTYDAVLRYGAFEGSEGIRRWSHPSFAEFHTACWIQEHAKTVDEKLRWLLGEAEGSLAALPSPVEAVAVWLASMDDALFDRLLVEAPYSLVRCDRATLDEERRARLVTGILAHPEQASLGWGGIGLSLRDLAGGTVDPILEECIHGRESSPRARYLALWIVWLGEGTTLARAAAETALDPKEDHDVRKLAVTVVVDRGDTALRQMLRDVPELTNGSQTAAAIDLKYAVLKGIWRRSREEESLITVEEVLTKVTPVADHIVHRCVSFVESEFAPKLRDREVPVVVTWAKAELSASPQSWGSLANHMFDAVIERAWESAGQQPVGEALADLFHACESERDHFRADGPGDRPRDSFAVRAVACAIVTRSPKDDTKLAFQLEDLLKRESWTWCVAQSRLDEAHSAIWSMLAFRKLRSILEGWQEPMSAEALAMHERTFAEFEAERAQNVALRDVSQWYFEGVLLDSDGARYEREQRARKASRAEERDTTRADLDSQIQDRFDHLDDSVERFWEFSRWVRASAGHGGYYEIEHSKQIHQTVWWENASKSDRARVLRAAEQYLAKCEQNAEEWFGANIWDYRAEAGELALALLALTEPDAFERLDTNLWAKWAPALLKFSSFHHEDVELRKTLFRRAMESAPESFAEWIDREVASEITTHKNVYVLDRLGITGNAVLARRLLARLQENVPNDALRELLEHAHTVFPDETFAIAMRVMGEPITDEFTSGRRLGAASFLLRCGGARGWDVVFPVLHNDAPFGRALVEKGGWPSERNTFWHVEVLSLKLLSEFWEWLSVQWPYKERHGGVYEIITGEEVRGAVLNEIASRAARPDEGDETVLTLRAMAAAHPEMDWLSYSVASAIRAVNARRWLKWSALTLARGFMRVVLQASHTAQEFIETATHSLEEDLLKPIHILHLSDLHIEADTDPIELLQPLAQDLRDPVDGLGVEQLDYLVVSGDLTNHATPEEFIAAHAFLAKLIERFKLPAQHVAIVPGNHDQCWDPSPYNYRSTRQIDVKRLAEGSYVVEGKGCLVRDEVRYPKRFEHFTTHLYDPLLQTPYPLDAAQQGMTFLSGDGRLQFILLNSAWQIDEHFPERSSILGHALSTALAAADDAVDRACESGRIASGAKPLRVAVWHHPVTGNEKIVDDAFLGRLQKADVRLCLHGHVHEIRADLVGYMTPTRRVHIVGAGSFGAPAKDRPEGVPALYNLIAIDPLLRSARVHTRGRQKPGGPFSGHAIWPGPDPHAKRTFYEVDLGEHS